MRQRSAPGQPKHGYTPTAPNLLCDCGKRATYQVQVGLINAADNRLSVYMPLCDDCYALFAEVDTGIEAVMPLA